MGPLTAFGGSQRELGCAANHVALLIGEHSFKTRRVDHPIALIRRHRTKVADGRGDLALTVRRGRAAIVLTGAMRHSGELERDGPANLRDAVLVAQVAGIPEAGPVVAMACEIHAARFVTNRARSSTQSRSVDRWRYDAPERRIESAIRS